MAARQTPKTDSSKTSEEMERYLDALIANHSVFADAAEKARKRGVEASEKLSKALCDRQREALELTKKLSTDPQAFSDNAKQMLKAATDAQTRAFDFAKELYSEQAEIGDEFRSTLKAMLSSSKDAAKAATDLARAFGANSPLSEAVKKSTEAFRS